MNWPSCAHKLTRLQMDNPGQVSGEIPALQLQISEIEKNLAEAGLERSVETIIFSIPAHAVSAALPEKSVLVEFIHLPDFAAGFQLRGAPPHRYAAFVLKASGKEEENIVADVDALETIFAMRKAEDSPPPVLVDLGEAAQIDAGVEDLLRAVDFGDDGKGTPRWRRKARYLYTRLVQPLENELKDAAHLIIAPDGALHSLPFEILPDQTGELISDHFSTSYVQVGREVIRFWEHFNPGEPALVIADPDFDLSAAQATPLDAGETQMDERLTVLQSAPRFASLAYTLAEGQSVAAALQVPLYSGASAVETLLQESRSPEIIHVATHGFYLRRVEPSGDAEDTLAARAALDDPLERSGLVLAGANAYLDLKTPPLRAQDGILFAAEIVDLDLHQTDLVCLSACQSGQGEIRLGEGLRGLRSAFSAAGCRSLVCALWQIPDQASQQLVNLFYTELLKGVPRAEALRSARRALQAAYPRDPLFWAGLVLDGSPAELYRFKPAGTLRVATINFREWGLNQSKERRKPVTPAEIAEDFYQQGLDYLDTGKTDEAFQAFDSAIHQPGGLLETACRARYQRAGMLRSLGRYPEAFEEYGRLLDMPDLPENLRISALSDRGTTHMLVKQYTDAIQDYSAALASTSISPSDQAWLLVNRGSAYRMASQPGAAIVDFGAVLAMEGAPREQRFKALLNRGDTHRLQDEYTAAVEDLSQALAMQAGNLEENRGVRISRALAFYSLGDYTRAVQDFSLLLKDKDLSSGYAEVCLTYRASSYQVLSQPESARADYQALLALPGISAETRAQAQTELSGLPSA